MASNSNFDYYVSTVKSYSTQQNYSMLTEFVQHQVDSLSKNANQLDNLLSHFDHPQHSIGILGILHAKYASTVQDYDNLFNQTQEFLERCAPDQVRCALSLFADLCHKYASALVSNGKANAGILPLQKAVSKAVLSNQLSSIHADFCLVCLVSKNLRAAVPVLDNDITQIMREGSTGFDAKYFLLYYYYGGMIYTALKKYERALYFFEVVITTPSVAVSHIMLEAFKKYILVSLILHEKVLQLPKYTSHVVAKYIKPLCQPYNDLVTAFATNNAVEVRSVMEKHAEVYRQDHNYGLVKQCLTFMYKKSIQRLTKTFLTLSLSDMASRVHLSGGAKEAEKYVLHMIADGEIFATINQRDGMVRFHDNPEKYDSAGMLKRLDQEMRKCMQLDEKLREMDKEISVNPQYIQKSSGVHDDDVPGSSKFSPYGAM